MGRNFAFPPAQKLGEQIFVRKTVGNHLVCGHNIFQRDSVLIAWGEEIVLFTPKMFQLDPHWRNWQAETKNFFSPVCLTSPHKLFFLQCWGSILAFSLMAVSKGLVGILKHSRVQSCLLKWAPGIRMIRYSLVQGLLWLTTYEEMKHISFYFFSACICFCQKWASNFFRLQIYTPIWGIWKFPHESSVGRKCEN